MSGTRFAGIEPETLDTLADAIRTRRLVSPFGVLGIQRIVDAANAGSVATDLAALAAMGLPPDALAILLTALALERRHAEAPNDHVEVVVTGPDLDGNARNTAVVVQELFAEARRSVLVVGFALYQGKQVFKTLADRFDAQPDLDVRFCLNIERRPGDTSRDGAIVARFAQRFAAQEWPGRRLPKVFFDPRALAMDQSTRPSLHAKCVVIDANRALVTSANFTEAAQVRNIELGLRVNSERIAAQIFNHFGRMIERGGLCQVPMAERQ
jgi:phosphatidylserine/phosphatidylglycerophosphate/cardiolipin synthase-like enzyme